ncbi:hypothetical protein AVEN_96053-1 [Araneus ventricosus]|uniref:Uncharacterized protein n=1 Tax=Araneus ventricosus TaxID=182803 RepID=A0A4Y2B392_ARAVE|nr:hypothetical protein AVEN_96053-1 [Araneus ventricosus]
MLSNVLESPTVSSVEWSTFYCQPIDHRGVFLCCRASHLFTSRRQGRRRTVMFLRGATRGHCFCVFGMDAVHLVKRMELSSKGLLYFSDHIFGTLEKVDSSGQDLMKE